jgi:O-glycosyl hydrolase
MRRQPAPWFRQPTCLGLRHTRLRLEQLEPRNLLSVAVQVDDGVTHQVINGWGTEYTKEYEPDASQRATILSLVYGQLGLNLGQAGQLLESPDNDFTHTRDSNPDPFTIDWNGFQGWQEQDIHDNWINAPSTIPDGQGGFLTARQLGFTDYMLGTSFPNIRWENPWLDAIRRTDPTTYLNKLAREVLAYELYYQNNYGEVPPLFQLGNEELSGNHAIYAGGSSDTYPGGPTQEMVDLVKTVGQRLADNGLGGVQFLVGTEETEYSSLNLASAILADPQAQQYAGVIGYHEYPYGSEYSSLARVLQDSGTGHPPADAIQVRNRLRDLGQQYGLPVWLTEVSHGNVGGVQGDTFNALRARAIDIHDNLIYADMSGFFFQGAYWDTVLQAGHFGNHLTLAQLQAEDGDAFVVIGDPTTNTWQLTMGAYALGHYSRWVHPGDIRVDAGSDDPLVQVTAFRDDPDGGHAFVLINNSDQPREVTISLAGTTFQGDLFGEQSTANNLWSPLGGITPDDPATVTLELPAQSVTSLFAPTGGMFLPHRGGPSWLGLPLARLAEAGKERAMGLHSIPPGTSAGGGLVDAAAVAALLSGQDRHPNVTSVDHHPVRFITPE